MSVTKVIQRQCTFYYASFCPHNCVLLTGHLMRNIFWYPQRWDSGATWLWCWCI